MLSLLNNICGQPFEEFISACFHRADMFSLTKNRWEGAAESKEHSCLLQRLRKYYIQTINTNHWFCYWVPEGYKLEVYLFTADAGSKKIILEEYNRIFHGNALWNQPEDLCFFEKRKLFAGSVSHENICYVYGRGDDWEDKIKQQGLWENIPDVLEEQIRIQDFTKLLIVIVGNASGTRAWNYKPYFDRLASWGLIVVGNDHSV